MSKLSFKYRKETVEQLKENQYDLFIIGGGITGAGERFKPLHQA